MGRNTSFPNFLAIVRGAYRKAISSHKGATIQEKKNVYILECSLKKGTI
jgi:hypothetical protein